MSYLRTPSSKNACKITANLPQYAHSPNPVALFHHRGVLPTHLLFTLEAFFLRPVYAPYGIVAVPQSR